MGESVDDRAEIAAMYARFGAMLASKGLTAGQAATFVGDHIVPLMTELLERVNRGEDPSKLQIVVQRANQGAA